MLVLQSTKKICPNTAILRFEDYAVHLKTEEILQDAKNKRAKLLEQADLQIKMLKESAQADIEKMHQQAEAEIEQYRQQKQFEMIFEMLNKGIDFFSTMEETLVQTIKSLALKIFEEIPPEERIYKLVKTTVKELAEGKTLHIYVHPDQCGLLKKNIKEIQQQVPTLERIEVVANKSLNLDECTLETETGILEAGLNLQLDNIMNAIKSMLRGS